MEPHAHRQKVRQLADDLAWLEDHRAFLALKEAQNRFKSLASALGEAFEPLWEEVTHGAPMPDWLQPLPRELRRALDSAEALLQTLADPASLEKLVPYPPPERAAWLREALKLLGRALRQRLPGVNYARALLYKELAAVPGQAMNRQLEYALEAFTDALDELHDDPLSYARVQARRVALLRDMAGLPGEDRPARLYQALSGFEEALAYLSERPTDYAILQFHRANLLRELAGLKGERERRSARMLEALAAYDEVLERLPPSAAERAQAQTNRASLLQEIATLPGEDAAQRWQEALAAGGCCAAPGHRTGRFCPATHRPAPSGQHPPGHSSAGGQHTIRCLVAGAGRHPTTRLGLWRTPMNRPPALLHALRLTDETGRPLARYLAALLGAFALCLVGLVLIGTSAQWVLFGERIEGRVFAQSREGNQSFISVGFTHASNTYTADYPVNSSATLAFTPGTRVRLEFLRFDPDRNRLREGRLTLPQDEMSLVFGAVSLLMGGLLTVRWGLRLAEQETLLSQVQAALRRSQAG
ncbi:MAG: hypothetical protein HC915_14540 [Anaerolineae bacterium]|nr:hypothetical protein [Anaerolineae bacterium]